jgi:hypothetical protein
MILDLAMAGKESGIPGVERPYPERNSVKS